jgi:hypothetical protein
MTFPGAETMNGGIIGLDCFLFNGLFLFFTPLISVAAILSVKLSVSVRPLARGGTSSDGEGEGLVSEGVSITNEVVLELDREWDFILRGFPPNDRRDWDWLLVIAQ